MIVDCHTHINSYEDEGVAALPHSLEKLQYEMKRNRIDFAIVLTSYKVNPGRPSTREAVEAMRDLKNLYVVAGISYLQYEKIDFQELREYLKEGSVRGLKLYAGYEPFYPADQKLQKVYELAEEFDLPVMIHSGDTYDPTGKVKYAHPLNVDEVAVDHPNVKIIICHLGNPWIRDCMEVVYKNKNVYTDISGLVLGDFTDRFESYMRKQLEEMILYGVEPDKVLYGTDWPLSSMESYRQFMEELKLPEKEKSKIYSENAITLFKLSPSDSSLHGGKLLNWLK